ncbi:zinc finger protein-like 1 homolog [Actinia tenebrosa]|uniref:Zinc finger protein-like 1 homolog n=1 Tax=Actinia tenebrosa TaxID=6105 RepID=A0A6P8IMK4_ACTTE|nr:zinc finger protein-like 1 homolog [Actinia tenebrosa]
MGLCKCSKKKVTNQFCFEHRVNVCEFCLVSSHSRCIVKSYIHWLQDSEYNPVCTLCNGSLEEGDVVRLVCYDVFHLACINKFCQSLPPNTAPAGYTCPNCKHPIFPPENMVSPVVDQLRQKLSNIAWARAGLGLPVIPTQAPEQSKTLQETQHREVSASYNDEVKPNSYYTTPTSSRVEQRPQRDHIVQMSQQTVTPLQATHTQQGHIRNEGTVSRKTFDKHHEDLQQPSYDHDENKYQRRGAIDWFTRWFRTRVNKPTSSPIDDPSASLKRTMMIFFLVILAFVTIVVIMTRVGRSAADRDPFLDPMANPHIKVQGSQS